MPAPAPPPAPPALVAAKLLERPKVQLHPEVVAPPASYGKVINVGPRPASISYRSKPTPSNFYTEVRKYFVGSVQLGIAEIGATMARFHYSDGECPTLIKEFKGGEREMHKWFAELLETKPK